MRKLTLVHAAILSSLLGIQGCSVVLHEPAADLAAAPGKRTWRVHCESGLLYVGEPATAGRRQRPDWVWAEDASGRAIEMDGRLRDGFLLVEHVHMEGDTAPAPFQTKADLHRACVETLSRRHGTSERELGKIRAAREGEGINVAFELPAARAANPPKPRLVVFGDSLSDAGKLRRRLKVFPLAPYWLGRFSNGPVWTDYLENDTGIAIQNHAYGGASMAHHAHVRTSNMLAMLRQGGQFFLTGSIDVQVTDYLENNVRSATVHEPDREVFVIWGGANDYIWKEPFSGEIDTFLNDPKQARGYESVVDDVVGSLVGAVRRLHAAGARRFLVPGLPDLGLTPIVLQNRTYFPRPPVETEDARKLELSRRLSELTSLHNRLLSRELDELRRSLPGIEIAEAGVSAMLSRVLDGRAPDGRAFDYGFDLQENARVVGRGRNARRIQDRCYHGGYFGSPGEAARICTNASRAPFWDVVHPSSYMHCWLAWSLRSTMAERGWIANAPAAAEQKERCEHAVAVGTAFFDADGTAGRETVATATSETGR